MTTTKRSLTLYLQGHEAGAQTAVRTVEQQAAADPDGERGRFLARLGREIDEDRSSLRDIMAKLGVRPSAPQNAVGLATAKLGQWGLRAQSPGEPQARLIGLESLSLGIEGKASLWRTLRELALTGGEQRLRGIDFDELIKRAEAQRQDLEPWRLEAAREAHASD